MLLTARECQNELPKQNLPLDLYQAVNLAVWMIVDKGFAMKRAIKISAKKYAVTQVKTEEVIRLVIPFEFFEERSLGYTRKHVTPNQNNNAYRSAMITRNADKRHMRAIAAGG